MSDAIRLSSVTLNAPDAIALARFYALITGGTARGDAGWATVTGPNADIGFQQIVGLLKLTMFSSDKLHSPEP